jgi:hypothetical protein
MSYNPIPPRVWSRVQDKCSTNTDTSQLVYVPLTNSYESLSKYNYDKQMLLKGNVLQYKNNSSNLTKKQRYTQIAKGQWAGRRKCFATQSETYTNPNTSSFQRVNYVNIPFPNNIVGAPNNVSGPFQYDVPNPFGCNTTVLEDGGSLVGNTYVNPCTQEVVRTTYNQPCNLTTASDVPGPVQVLCWDPKVATWYPRQRYIMPTSGTKWPEGYKGLVSAVTPIPPILSLDAASFCPIVLSWTFNNCLPISNFYIYQNDVLVQIVPYTTTTVSITGLVPSTTYSYYIRSVSSGIESDFSNSVVVIIPPIDVPTLAPIVATCPVVLNWSISYNCPVIDSFNVYQDSVLIQNVFTTSATITGLIPSTTYSYYIRSVSSGIESAISNTESVTYPAVDVPTLAPIVATCPIVLNWSVSDNCPAIDSFNVYQDSILIQNVSYPTTSATITGLIPSTTYSYYIRSVSSGIESAISNTESVTYPAVDVPTLAPIVATCPVVLNWSVSDNCPAIDSFNVYQDSVLIQNVPYPTTSATITGLIPLTTYSYYIRSVSSGIESADSNTESVTYPAVDVPTLAPIVATCPVVLNWSVSDNCPAIDSFNVYQDSILVQNIPYPTTSATITGLVPSTTYSYYIRSVSSGIESTDSNTESVTPQPFNVTGSPVILYLNNYYYIRFITNGTITFIENINNLNLICVGGGGGGGGGINGNEDPFGSIVGGGGGGSGGIGHLENVAVNNIQYNVTVGSGGLGLTGNNSGVSGTSTSFISSTSINYLTSTGGIGGNGQYGTYPNPGLMGTCTSIYSPTIYTSANGGVGYNNNTPQDSTNGSDTIPAMPITTSSGVNYLFGGGGGGGGGDPRTNGGKAGLNGIGGIAKASSVNNGENAINPGAGGGGSGDINEGGKGGDGGDGVLLIYFYYTC